MIFIAKNYNGEIINISSAVDEKSYNAYCQGKGLKVDSIQIFDIVEDRQNEKMGYVTPILLTKEFNIGNFLNPNIIIQVVKG